MRGAELDTERHRVRVEPRRQRDRREAPERERRLEHRVAGRAQVARRGRWSRRGHHHVEGPHRLGHLAAERRLHVLRLHRVCDNQRSFHDSPKSI